MLKASQFGLFVNGKYKINSHLFKKEKSQNIISWNKKFKGISHFTSDYIIPYIVIPMIFIISLLTFVFSWLKYIFWRSAQNTIEFCVRIYDTTFYDSGTALLWREKGAGQKDRWQYKMRFLSIQGDRTGLWRIK